jgi:hypothetical protein
MSSRFEFHDKARRRARKGLVQPRKKYLDALSPQHHGLLRRRNIMADVDMTDAASATQLSNRIQDGAMDVTAPSVADSTATSRLFVSRRAPAHRATCEIG